jgi:hypothetical protein
MSNFNAVKMSFIQFQKKCPSHCHVIYVLCRPKIIESYFVEPNIVFTPLLKF